MKKLSEFKDIILFFLIITVFYVLFKYFESAIDTNVVVSVIINFLVANLVTVCSVILNIFGIHSSVYKDIINLPNGFSIQIQYGCTGFQQFLLIIALFLLFPGPWKKKAWFIPAALIGLHLLNIVRLVGLCVYFSYHTHNFQLIHHWIFRPFIYFMIFISWVIWVELIRPEKIKNSG